MDNQNGDMVDDSSAADGPDTGLIVGIVVGAVLCLLGACLVAFAVVKNRKDADKSSSVYSPETPPPAHSRPAAPLPAEAAGGSRVPVYGEAPRKALLADEREIGEYRYVPCDAALTDGGGTVQSAGSDSTYGDLKLSPRQPLPGLNGSDSFH
jgi:hypothetical protein